jgi:hypothetical protein
VGSITKFVDFIVDFIETFGTEIFDSDDMLDWGYEEEEDIG